MASPQRSPSRVLAGAAAAACALVAVALWLFARGGPAGEVAPGVSRAEASEPQEGAANALEDLDALPAARAPLADVSGGAPIPAGVRLTGPGRLAGRVVERGSGAPVAGARVDLLPLPPAGSAPIGRLLQLANVDEGMARRAEPVAVAASGPSGEFAFEGVRPGIWFVEARAPRHVPDSVARARVLSSGEGGPVDVFVREGGRVLGVVLLPGGGSASGASVVLTPDAGSFIELARRGDFCVLEAQTDGEGRFAIEGVPPGDGWEVTAVGRGFALTHAIDVEVRAGEDTWLEIRGREGGSVEGRLLSAGEGGRSAPLAGGHVAVVPRGLRDLDFVLELLELSHAVTDGDGRFTMAHLPPGELELVAVAQGHVAARGPAVVVVERMRSSAPDFELAPGPVVRGRVVDSAGAPLEGVTVRWNPVDLRNFQFDFSFAPLLTQSIEGFEFPRTGDEGRFTAGAFPGEPPHRIEFRRSGFEDATHRWDPAQEGGEIEVVLHAGGAVEGIVMDAQEHVPLASFTIESRQRIETQPDAPGRFNPFSGGEQVEHPEGRFRMDALRPGEVALTFRAPGYLPETVEGIAVAEGEVRRGVIVRMRRGGMIAGRVVDLEGDPVAGAQVFAVPAGADGGPAPRGRRRDRRGPPAPGEIPPGLWPYAASLGLMGDRAVLSAPDGSFELTGVEPGLWVAVACHRDFRPGRSEPVAVAAGGEPARARIELSAGSALFGTVRDRFGRPVPGAIVLALAPAGLTGGSAGAGGLHQGRTDAAGAYRIERMEGGSYFVVLSRGDEALDPMSFLGTLNLELVHVPEGERVRFDVVDTSSGATRVTGRVTARGRPVERGSVTALCFESESLLGVDVKVTAIREGSYEFAGLAPGAYQLDLNDIRLDGRRVRTRIPIEVPDLPEVRIDLELPEGAVAGLVLDARSGEPIPAADVRLRPADPIEGDGLLGRALSRESGVDRTRTGEDGAFLFRHLAGGEYELSVRPRGGAADHAPSPPVAVRVRDGRRSDVEVRLAPALALRGTVADASDTPLAGAVVIATRRDERLASPVRATSDGDGAFELRPLSPGPYDIAATCDGFAQASLEVALEPGGAEPLEIVLSEGTAARVLVLSATGEPLSGAAARLVPEGRPGPETADVGRLLGRFFTGQGLSGRDGWVDLGRHPAGRYTLEVQRGLSRAEPQAVELGEGGSIELRAVVR